MADIEPPSFSLGLDFELESEPQNPAPNLPANKPIGNKNIEEVEEEVDDELRAPDSDPDDQGPTLRRLRRGGSSSSKPISNPPIQQLEKLPTSHFVDEDIEEFSSQEHVDADDLPGPQHRSLCSSSKIPLPGSGIFTNQRESKVINRKRKPDSSFPSTSVDGSKRKSVLPDFAESPLRMFRLIDSDSDDPSTSFCVDKDVPVGSSKQNEHKFFTNEHFQATSKRRTESTSHVLEKQDLWKDFNEIKSCAVPTPAFDEFCEEYFNNARQKPEVPCSTADFCSSGQKKNANFIKRTTQHESGSDSPPSHRYFFHDDLRIQSLVRNRLPYFFPLGARGETGGNPSSASSIDYMTLFCHGEGAKRQTGRQVNVRKTTQRSGRKANNSNVENILHAYGDWTNPRQAANTPTDAGRRRVHAEGQSTGHWFTAENGKRVYVTSTGQELTGRLAYRHYRKESGKGFRGSKKKSATKKSTPKKSVSKKSGSKRK